jgi:copper(I)-binding protein
MRALSPKIPLLAVAGLLLTLCACSASGGQPSTIQISDPWVRAFGGMIPPGPGTPTPEPTKTTDAAHLAPIDTGVFMTIRNTGAGADRLVGAASDVATRVELHTMEMSGGQSVMRQVPAIDIPAGGEVQLKVGILHVMMFGLKRDLKVGDMVDVSLQFEKAGTVPIKAVVRQP